MNTNPTPKPTQVAYPRQAVMRTLTAVLSAAIMAPVIFAVIVQIIDAILEEGSTLLTQDFQAALTTFSGVLVVLTGIFTRIMAIPAVNAALASLGLGAAPQNALAGFTKKPLNRNPEPSAEASPQDTTEFEAELDTWFDEGYETPDTGEDSVG